AYASPRPFLTPSQGWLPARAGSPLAGQDSHLLDDTQSFMESLPPPIPFDPQGLVALHFLSAPNVRMIWSSDSLSTDMSSGSSSNMRSTALKHLRPRNPT